MSCVARCLHSGLVGKNGIGKSTLLRRMHRRQVAGFPAHLSTMHVTQEVVGGPESVLDTVLSSDVERVQLLKEEQALLKRMAASAPASASSPSASTSTSASAAASSPTASSPTASAASAPAKAADSGEADSKSDTKTAPASAAGPVAVAVVDPLVKRYEEVCARLREIESDTAVARATQILNGLQFTPQMQQSATERLSGGWRYLLPSLSTLPLRVV